MKLWENGAAPSDVPRRCPGRSEQGHRDREGVERLANITSTSSPARPRFASASRRRAFVVHGWTDALTVPSGEGTVNFGWLEPNDVAAGVPAGRAPRVRPRARHDPRASESGGRRPDPVGQAKVYTYYAQQGWSQGGRRLQHLRRLFEESTNHTAFDPTSIMEYAIPDLLTVGSYSIGWNTKFCRPTSTSCAASTRRLAGPVELTVGGARTTADLSVGGEVDIYRFDVPAAKAHIMTTRGTDRHGADARRPG